ncbi:bis(5'-nucleosyl)-tetraphosphatase (symmetrical) [Solemya velum gill symbiont]|uniref:symmetrical bis(5'-nucleosyl)-tetraphosphatase n=1 Tax=Solemya velum gill symbiont TaxID=2340 RepID=UPI0009966CAB|nr:symmetrical bis(5'-nucleosyl)-tetraphosphatase [Solemya velum gill symbiont]OOZ16564.1 bis(5'-nucleosyl)-tetraphosphatase (symmetrical) [Solemya velum gill symbiont]OOZ26052.1 bis(5'-nucleosyl)-tetraphosphatase (symmetrical) [Solemya velum gill symbiont]
MATYVIGDVQGCFDELQRLLEHIEFDAQQDQLWFAGDLVNRGPKSLEVLRFVKELGDSAVCVLGNHDLHLLATWSTGGKKKLKNDLQPIFDAPDRDELLEWLCLRPLMHTTPEFDFCLIHAGLPPQWDLTQALACAQEVESVLADQRCREHYFAEMYGDKPNLWSEDLGGQERLRFITNCFTRLRFCTQDGHLALDEKGVPGSQKKGVLPWYLVPGRQSENIKLLFGHWSMLGYHHEANTWALDTGCLWGGELSALRIDVEPPVLYAIDCPCQRKPG